MQLLLLLNFQKTKAQIKYSFEVSKNAYSFQLNKQQGFNSLFNLVDEENNELLRSVESPHSSIEVFDLNTGVFKHNIKTKGFGITSFKKNADGTFWIYDAWLTKFLLIDKYGKILKELKDVPRENIDLVSVDGKFKPIIAYKNAIYTTGLFLFRADLDVSSPYYLNSGPLRKTTFENKVSYMGKLSAKAKTSFYGNMNSYNFTQNKNTVIVAPLFSEELQVINLDNGKSKFVSVDSKYANLITPMGPIATHAKFTNAENNAYGDDKHALIGIVYDKYRDIYYRFVRMPGTQIGNISYAMYAMDKNFKVLSYFDFPKGYLAANFFITAKGLHVMDKSAYQKDNTKIIYDLFKLVKK